MAMNAAVLKAAIVAALQAEFGTDYDDIADDHQLPGFDQTTFWTRYWGACATAIVTHITNNAKCNGLDSGTHTHDNVGIV